MDSCMVVGKSRQVQDKPQEMQVDPEGKASHLLGGTTVTKDDESVVDPTLFLEKKFSSLTLREMGVGTKELDSMELYDQRFVSDEGFEKHVLTVQR